MRAFGVGIVVWVILCSAWNSHADSQTDELIQDLQHMISHSGPAPRAEIEAVRKKIETSSREIVPLLISRAKAPGLSEKEVAVYIWAIGWTKSPAAVDEVIALARGNNSTMLAANTYKALANIGGDRAGQYLHAELIQTSDPALRFNLLNYLALMQYGPALPHTIEILDQDYRGYAWQAVFVFGKYGDKAVPLLLSKVDDPSLDIRANAMMMLGQWLIAPEAIEPMKRQFWREDNPDVRTLILSSLERINSDWRDVEQFSQKVIQNESDGKIVRFAKETIANLKQIQGDVTAFKSQKISDRPLFERIYHQLYNTMGREGDYDTLALASTRADEERLKQLKEAILQRDSDECFYDYQKINEIIMLNRLIAVQ